jgi:hypothetical protein
MTVTTPPRASGTPTASGGVSDRQWDDVLGVIKTQGNRLDLAYLHLWAGRKGIADLLERAVAET